MYLSTFHVLYKLYLSKDVLKYNVLLPGSGPEARCEDQGGKLCTTWKQFSYLTRSLTSTAAPENGARQCARDYWECTHFREATQSQIPMEEEKCPPCKYSLKRKSTNLIQFCGRTVLLVETCSQRALLLSVPHMVRKKAPR